MKEQEITGQVNLCFRLQHNEEEKAHNELQIRIEAEKEKQQSKQQTEEQQV